MGKVSVSRLVMFFALTVACFGFGLLAASADEIVVGSFGPDTFSATLQVSGGTTPATGEVITGGSLTLSGPIAPGTYNDWFAAEDLYGDTGVYLFQVSQGGGPSNPPYIDLYFSDYLPISTAGLCTAGNPCAAGYGPTSSQLRPIYDPSGNSFINEPEPGTMSLLAFGLLGLAFLFRKEGPQTEGPQTR